MLPAAWPILNATFDKMTDSVRRHCGINAADRLTANDIFLVKYTAEARSYSRSHFRST